MYLRRRCFYGKYIKQNSSHTIHYHIGQFSYDWKNICRVNRKIKCQIYIEICAKVMGQSAGNVINMMFFLKS
ncbi:unnamed protein product [Clavelina lepadiformis]|uniref:Uncharacterized protein n=1 Tax=Clavelina lepadiformis TaxID=159417 RepID=A0ABP0GGT3_CLALP